MDVSPIPPDIPEIPENKKSDKKRLTNAYDVKSMSMSSGKKLDFGRGIQMSLKIDRVSKSSSNNSNSSQPTSPEIRF